MIIDPRHLEQLAAIIDHGTLSEAAKQTATSQPSLSRMLSTLESRLGVLLFERNSRPLVPTEMGRKLADQGRAVRTARLRAVEDVVNGLRGMAGELRIGAPPFLCERLVGEAISGFCSTRPEIRVELIADYFPGLMSRMALNQLEVLICPTKLLVPSKADLTVDRLFQDRHVIAARRDHALTRRRRIQAEDLAAVTWIGHSDRSLLRFDMATTLAAIGVPNPTFGFQSESAGAILEMLRRTDFLTVLPRYALSHPLDETLAILPVDLSTTAQTVGLITRADRVESPLLQAFKVHMQREVGTRIPHPVA